MLQSYPCLRPDAELRIADEGVELEIDDAIFSISGLPEVPLLQAVLSLNGLLDIPEIASQCGLSEEAVQTVVRRLDQAGVLGYAPTAWHGPYSAETFNALCATLYRQWKARLFSHPLWTGLTAGSLPRPVFVGWVVESWWFITGVQDRLPMAIACSDNRAIRALFARHFCEEWDHFHFFEQALDALGVTAEERARSQPLPATRAVQHWMRNAARADPLRYAACSGFLESTGNDRANARAFFDRVAAWYAGDDRSSVRPMIEHVALDEDYGHEGVVKKVARELGEIDRERACAALRAAFGLVETLEMWSTDILRHYQAAHAFPLRSARAYRGVRT